MANIIRSAKSGSDWLANELVAYNITVQRQGVAIFFGRELGSIHHLDPNLLPPPILPLPISLRIPIAFLPTSTWHHMQIADRKLISIISRKASSGLLVSTRSAQSFGHASHSFSRQSSTRATPSLRLLRKRLPHFSKTTKSVRTLIFLFSA